MIGRSNIDISQPQFISEMDFQKWVARILQLSPKFDDIEEEALIKFDGKINRIDITCTEKDNNGNTVSVAIECKSLAPLTRHRVENIISFLKGCSKEKVVLAVAGQIQPYIETFKKNDIDVWDLDYFQKNFSDEINKLREPNDSSPLQFTGIRESEYISNLEALECGKKDCYAYEEICKNVLEYLFHPDLEKAKDQLSDFFGINRRDLILANYAQNGFWDFLRNRYRADFIVVDAKNLKNPPTKKDFLQMANYLKEGGIGLFGIICARKPIAPKGNLAILQREYWITDNKLIIFLEDSDLREMLELKAKNMKPEAVIRQKVEDFRLSI